jgi:hypothetical protein
MARKPTSRLSRQTKRSQTQRLVSHLCASQDNMARKPTSRLSRQIWLASRLHASQGKQTLANAMARKPTLCLSRQQRLASQLHASQDKQTLANAMARKPNKCTVIPTRAPPHPSGVLRRILSVILDKCVCSRYPGVHSTCDHYQARDLRRFPPNATPLFRNPKLFPWSSSFPVFLALARSWLFRLPVSCPVPGSFGPPGPVFLVVGGVAYGGRRGGGGGGGGGGWSKVRLTSGGAGGRKEKERRRWTVRLTVARRSLLMSAKSSVSMPISKVAYAERQQGADQIGKIGVDPPRGLRSKGVSSNV